MVKYHKWAPVLLAGILSSLLLLVGCAQQTTGGSTGFDWTFIIFLVVIFAAFYLFMIRPQRSRQKQQQKLLEDLKPGDQVVTSAGMYGEIVSQDETSVLLKVESGATIRVAKPSILGKRLP